MTAATTRAALLARVSTEEQVEGLSLGAQLAAMRARCAAEGWEVVREYVGEGESAFTGDVSKRPVLRALLADAGAGVYDVLLVHESSRLARHMGMAAGVLERLDRAGVRLVNLQSGVDYSSAPGRLFFGVEASFNEYYSRQLGEHIRKGKRALWDAGLHVGDVPFGYVRPVEGSAREPLVPIPAEAAAVRWAFEARAAGRGYLAIAEELNARGLRPRSKRGVGRFGISGVQSMLENWFYAGYVVHKGARKRGKHAAVVSEELFEEAQRRVTAQQYGRSVRLLSGIGRCARCGGPVWGGRSGRTGDIAYYREPAKARGRLCELSGRMCRADAIEEQVDAVMLGMRLQGSFLDEVHRRAALPPETDATKTERARLTGILKRARGMWVQTGDPAFETMARDTERALQSLPQEGDADVLRVGRRWEQFAEIWADATVEERNEILRVVMREVLVDVEDGAVVLVPRADFAGLFDARARAVGFTPGRSGGGTRVHGYTPAELGVAG